MSLVLLYKHLLHKLHCNSVSIVTSNKFTHGNRNTRGKTVHSFKTHLLRRQTSYLKYSMRLLSILIHSLFIYSFRYGLSRFYWFYMAFIFDFSWQPEYFHSVRATIYLNYDTFCIVFMNLEAFCHVYHNQPWQTYHQIIYHLIIDEEENTGPTEENTSGSNIRNQRLFFITFILTLIISLALVSFVIFIISK